MSGRVVHIIGCAGGAVLGGGFIHTLVKSVVPADCGGDDKVAMFNNDIKTTTFDGRGLGVAYISDYFISCYHATSLLGCSLRFTQTYSLSNVRLFILYPINSR